MFWMLAAFFCRLSASAWVLARTPSTCTSSSTTAETESAKSTSTSSPAFDLDGLAASPLAADVGDFDRVAPGWEPGGARNAPCIGDRHQGGPAQLDPRAVERPPALLFGHAAVDSAHSLGRERARPAANAARPRAGRRR